MGFATFSGPLRIGTVRDEPGRNTGLVLLTQTYDTGVVTSGVGNIDVRMGTLPQGALVTDVYVDQIVLPGGTSTATVSVGTAAGGTQLSGAAIATTSGGRYGPGFSDSYLAALLFTWATAANTGDVPIWVRYAVGVAAGVGRAIVTVRYIQRSSDGRTSPNPLFA